MVTQVTPKANIGSEIGQGLTRAVDQYFQPAYEQQYQQGRLQNAFSNLQPGGNFLDQLKSIAPALLTTPGGAQALAEISPLLAKSNQSQTQLDALNKWQYGNSNENKLNAPGQQSAPMAQQGQTMPGPNGQAMASRPTPQRSPEDKYRHPEIPSQPTSTFPERTTGPQTQPEMSPQQLRDYAGNLTRASIEMGNPISLDTALAQANQINAGIVASNNRINQQKQEQEAAIKEVTSGLVNQAKNRGLIQEPEDETFASKLAWDARNEPEPAKQWEYVRDGLRNLETHRNKIKREFDLPGPGTAAYRKLVTGTYKDKDTVIKNMQPDLDFYRSHGLFNEARGLLSDIGFGPEDTERALFPPNKQEMDALQKFGRNEVRYPTPKLGYQNEFPGEENNIKDPKKFESFKNQLGDFLKSNPKANWLNMRGYLNQDRGYSWPDISRAINELIEEKKVTPDYVQDQQLQMLNNAPLPGMAQIFDFLWKGTK